MSAPSSLRSDAEAALAEAVAAHGEDDWSCASLTDWIVDGLRRRGYGHRAVYHESPHGHSYVVVHSDGERYIVDAWEPEPLPVRVKIIWRHGEVPADQEPEAYGGRGRSGSG